MKKFLFFLLVPLFAFTQYYDNTTSTFTYKDILSIDSKDAFLKQMFKHKYSNTGQGQFRYSLNPDENGLSSSFAYYYPETDTFWLDFTRTGTKYTGTPQEKDVLMQNVYDEVLNTVDRRCKFVEMKTIGNSTYALYDCRKAKFNRYIGFTIENSSGIITTFIK
jgi:hypothetical protein